MIQCKYALKADQHTSGYGGKWLNIDTPVTVNATDFSSASAKALALMPPSRKDTDGWRFFITRVEELDPEPEITPIPQPPEFELRRRFRLKGVR